MPVILPTPTELLAMDWHKRDKAIRTTRQLLRDYGGMVEAVDIPVRTRLTPEALAERKRLFGERVREEARRLEQG